MDIQTAKLMTAMVQYDQGDAKRIQHFIKVHNLAAVIGKMESLEEDMQCILETAAILHDIGIHISEQKYGSSSGKYQEIEGPAEAEKLMLQVGGYSNEQIERVKYLIGHHHTYKNMVGLDYQILVEADFLVNLYEDASPHSAVESVRSKIFKTQTGIRLLDDMFGEKSCE
ncbi:HD domain-containing protein [Oscillospiraceae bacterium MB08-C2-2]|nr:HD domain-containing protein [Oscillospiraceae bacterium MB08-C2-2]